MQIIVISNQHRDIIVPHNRTIILICKYANAVDIQVFLCQTNTERRKYSTSHAHTLTRNVHNLPSAH